MNNNLSKSRLSGIANVMFQGNPGYSTPTAEIIWFSLQNRHYAYIALEKNLKQTGEKIEPQESYYDAGKIVKDFEI